MKLKGYILLIVITGTISNFFSQTDSPIGKWVLTEHLVFVEIDTITSIYTHDSENVFNNEFKASIIFEENGVFKQTVNDKVTVGRWKLSKIRKKMTIRLNYHKWKFNWNRSRDFEKHFFLSERFNNHYGSLKDYNNFGGESKYIRVSGQEPSVNQSLLIGKWRVTHVLIGKKEFSSTLEPIEFMANGMCHQGNNTGKWKVNGSKITIDMDDKGNTIFPAYTTTIEILTELTFVESGTEGNKKHSTYWEKMNE